MPDEGCGLLVADYNQIELRCIAHLAEDPGLIAAFDAGADIHTATASRVFGVDKEQGDHRAAVKAKMVSYGLAYGMEAYGLGQRLNIPTEEAAEILDAYFVAFPSVKAYMERTVAEARERGYTETLFGRRRQIPELSSSNFRIRQAGERQAMNAGIQGLAADIFKVALVRLDHELEARRLASRLILQVHDEVILEVPPAEHEEVTELTQGAMKGAVELRVPLGGAPRVRSVVGGREGLIRLRHSAVGPNGPGQRRSRLVHNGPWPHGRSSFWFANAARGRRRVRPDLDLGRDGDRGQVRQRRHSAEGVDRTSPQVGVQAGLPARLVEREPRERPGAPLVRAGGRPSRARPTSATRSRRAPRRRSRSSIDALGLTPGTRVLDVGCGPGRHARALAERSGSRWSASTSRGGSSLACGAPPGGAFVQADARRLAGRRRQFDVAISLCQGAFGCSGGPGSAVDEDVLTCCARWSPRCVPAGAWSLSAFSAYFQVRYLDDVGQFDAGRGVQHEHTEVRDEDGRGRRRSSCGRRASRPASSGCWSRAAGARRRRRVVGRARAATGRRHLASTSPSSW